MAHDDEQWERLLAYLNTWSTAAEVAPGRIDVMLQTPGDGERTVEIRMTPDQWDDMASVAWGSFDLAAQEVRRSVDRLGSGQRYLLFADYMLYPSSTPEPPVDPRFERLSKFARENPSKTGHWFAYDRDGNPKSFFGQAQHDE